MLTVPNHFALSVPNPRPSSGWDVVALQEVWHARERDALRSAALAAGLRYSRHFEHGCGAPVLGAGMGGTGLLVLSRFPIAESFFWVRVKSRGWWWWMIRFARRGAGWTDRPSRVVGVLLRFAVRRCARVRPGAAQIDTRTPVCVR